MTSNFVLLTGAGYSKNWGSWLATELWAAILGHYLVQDNKRLKEVIWKYRIVGFEEIFLDKKIIKNYQNDFLLIVKDVFINMHQALNFDDYIYTKLQRLIMEHQPFYKNFLPKFNSIFTLNQDIFFESLYPYFDMPGRTGYYYPYLNCWEGIYRHLKGKNLSSDLDGLTVTAVLAPASLNKFNPNQKLIPYYKLHGSINFKESNKSDIMIMGGSKPEQINKIPLLKKYHENFEEELKSGNVRLMIIGYSFSDWHINKIIFEAVEDNNLQFWIINTSSLNQLIENTVNAEMKKEDSRNKNVFLKKIDKYSNIFGKALISITQNTLYNIFNDNLLEFVRIRNNFFK